MKFAKSASAAALISHALAFSSMPIGKTAAISLASALLSQASITYALPAERRQEEADVGGLLADLLGGGKQGQEGTTNGASGTAEGKDPEAAQAPASPQLAGAQAPANTAPVDPATMRALMQMVAQLGPIDPALCQAAQSVAGTAGTAPPPSEVSGQLAAGANATANATATEGAAAGNATATGEGLNTNATVAEGAGSGNVTAVGEGTITNTTVTGEAPPATGVDANATVADGAASATGEAGAAEGQGIAGPAAAEGQDGELAAGEGTSGVASEKRSRKSRRRSYIGYIG